MIRSHETEIVGSRCARCGWSSHESWANPFAGQTSVGAWEQEKMAVKRELSDDTLEYWLFPAIPEATPQHGYARYLEEQLDTYVASFGNLLVDYIWQNQPFQLQVVPKITGWCILFHHITYSCVYKYSCSTSCWNIKWLTKQDAIFLMLRWT